LQFIDPSLPREIFSWRSPRLGLEMPIVRYGNWGRPLLVFPTAQADFLENERFFLIKSIEPLIKARKLTVFSIDSINKHAWMNKGVSVPERGRRQQAYSEYIELEVVPHIRRSLQQDNARIMVTGASFGGFHAANAFLRRPDLFDTLLAMSGFYDLTGMYTQGYMDDNIYFNNPLSYLPRLSDHGQLEQLRRNQIHILSGQGEYELPSASRRLSQALWDKAVPNNLDLWGADMRHDWPTWRDMLPHYLHNRVGL
jgi:esterase/lipase superfamily enzyme